ncbi:MAG: sulfatase-like hydrolase/transferase [Phycisphaeraceae bacterium]
MAPERPNLLLIWTDEQRPDTMACYGNRTIRTPSFDKLAATSFVFDHCYCAQPVCTPSRGTILTGLWPHQHGAINNNIPLNREAQTIAELVDDSYHTAYYGKWHLGDEIIAQHGFDEWVSVEDGIYRAYYSRPEYLERRSDYHQFLVRHGFPPDSTSSDGARVFSRNFAAAMSEPFTKAGFLGQEAAHFIRDRPRDQPWLLSVNFLEPHMPFFGPRNRDYDPDALEVSPVFGRKPDQGMSLRNRYTADQYIQRGQGGWPCHDDWHRRRLRANYDGLVTMVDNAVGRILEALEASGQAENTIVVFTSDHGDMMGDHAQVAKCVMYEQSVGVPLLVRVPWLNQTQQHVEGRFSQIDLVPTLLELMGQTVPEHCAGTSRAPVLCGERTLADNDVIIVWRPSPNAGANARSTVDGYSDEQARTIAEQQWRTIITADGWKLNLCATDRCELHDLNEDPWEQCNLIDDPDCQRRVEEMTEKIRAWQRATDDEAALVEA